MNDLDKLKLTQMLDKVENTMREYESKDDIHSSSSNESSSPQEEPAKASVTRETADQDHMDPMEKSAHDIAALALKSLGQVQSQNSGVSSSYGPAVTHAGNAATAIPLTTTSPFGTGHFSSQSVSNGPPNSGAAIPGTDGESHCYECGEKFSNTGDLRRHLKVSHQRQTYKCRKCGQLFNSIADRQTHKNNKHFSTISCPVKADNFKEFAVGTVLTSERNEAGYFRCPSEYCTFLTRIPGYWYDHIHHVEHNGVNPQRRKRRQSSVHGLTAPVST